MWPPASQQKREKSSFSTVSKERRRERVAAALDGLSDADVWEEVARRLENKPMERQGIKQAEIETLLAQKPSLGEDRPEGDFYARRHPLQGLPKAAEGKVESLILVHRLREVVAQIGFTRFEPSFANIQGELDLDVQLAPLARDATWLPACQHRGEGIFLSFSAKSMEDWLAHPAVQTRGKALVAGFESWQAGRASSNKDMPSRAEFPGLPFILLHSLSHLLITALALDCGYSASSIRERIYASPAGYGILLYTGSHGSEGTLGGLVDKGKHVGRLIDRALELGRLCSNDPVCSQHHPSHRLEERYLHGAACHGCLLIS